MRDVTKDRDALLSRMLALRDDASSEQLAEIRAAWKLFRVTVEEACDEAGECAAYLREFYRTPGFQRYRGLRTQVYRQSERFKRKNARISKANYQKHKENPDFLKAKAETVRAALTPLDAGATAEVSVLVPRTRGNLILGYREGQTELRLR